MRVAWRELRREPRRFVVAIAVLSLLSILLIFLGGLLDGLTGIATGAYRAQRAELVVYSADSQNLLARSRIDARLRQQVEKQTPDAVVGGLGAVTLGGRLDSAAPGDLISVTLYGYELAPAGLPDQPPAPGEVYADESLRPDGVTEGSMLRVGAAKTPLTVIGFVDEATNSSPGTLWGSVGTWRDTLAQSLPGQRLAGSATQALVVDVPAGSAAATAERIDDATAGATSTLTIDQAVDAIPGVSAQRITFNQILGVTTVVVVVVVALFFALLTVERLALYGVLKAVGARSRTLFAGVVLQAVVVTMLAAAIGIAVCTGLAAVIPPGSIPYRIGLGRIVGSVVVLLGAALLGCTFSLRRVLRVDPAAAIGGNP